MKEPFDRLPKLRISFAIHLGVTQESRTPVNSGIKGGLNVATRGPFIHSLISCLFFFDEENRFFMLFQTYTKLAFGLSDILIITVIVGNRIDSVGFLLQKRKILLYRSIHA